MTAWEIKGFIAQANGVAEGTGGVKHGMPKARADERKHGLARRPEVAFSRGQPIPTVGADAGGAKKVGGVLDGVKMAPATGRAKICLRSFIVPDARHPLRVIGVVMVLVNRTNSF